MLLLLLLLLLLNRHLVLLLLLLLNTVTLSIAHMLQEAVRHSGLRAAEPAAAVVCWLCCLTPCYWGGLTAHGQACTQQQQQQQQEPGSSQVSRAGHHNSLATCCRQAQSYIALLMTTCQPAVMSSQPAPRNAALSRTRLHYVVMQMVQC
jgi:hypothetical protein